MAIYTNFIGRRNKKSFRIINEINVTPLVDVMLVLLVIFMITAPMLVAGINVDLPETTASPMTGQDEPLTITIDRNGNIYLMDTQIPRNNITSKLKAITKENFNTRIFVRGDRRINYGEIIFIINEIREAGFNKVGLVTNIKQDE